MPTSKAYARARPYRVAFLIDEQEHWRVILDAIAAASFAHWGGRFNLLVPCEYGDVRESYREWLEFYDPDIIYSYVDLADHVIARLHEANYPAFLIRHQRHADDRNDRHAFHPRLPVAPLTVTSVAGVLTRGDMFAASRPISLIDTHTGAPPSQFLQENFGCYNQSLSPWPIGRDMAEFFQTVTFASPEIQGNPRIMPRPQGETVSTEAELVDRLAKQRNLVGLAQLSAALTPRIELSDMAWSHTANFVVGDSFADRVVFWNARLHLPVYLDGIVTLKVTTDDLDDPVRFQSIVEMLKNRVRVPLGGNTSHTNIVVRSASVPSDQLQAIANRLKASNTFNAYTVETVASVDAVVPSAQQFGRYHDLIEAGSPFQRTDWHEFDFGESELRPPRILPRHLRETPQLPASAKQGVWALDLDIERQVNHSGIENVQHRWRFPRRLRLTGAFLRGYQLGPNSPIIIPRCTRDALLGIAIGTDGSPPTIAIPTDETVFRYGLCAERDWWPFVRGKDKRIPGVAFDIRPSDKGRYLTALLRMARRVDRASEIFLSGFWRQQFELLGATPKATEERIATVKATLRKRLRENQIQSDDDWTRLAQTVLSQARVERAPSRYLRYDDLERRFEEYRNAYWLTHQHVAPREEWDDHERRSLASSVKYLCELQVLHQGHEWRCPQCYNNNWMSIETLARMMECGVCGTSVPAPVADPWHFRLNGFVAEGLREHGVLPVIWCLAHYAESAQASLYFLEPHELFFAEKSIAERKPDAELDLLIVADGLVRLCEAKASRLGINVQKLAALAERIRPDVVTLAVMEGESQRLSQLLAELQRRLGPKGINAELLTMAGEGLHDGPYLPNGRTFRTRLF